LAKAGARVLVLEKEAGPARHQSGRNSGVIHAGYNLKPGTLKAKYCVEGSRRLRAYCREHGIPMTEGGILIVARSDAERATLQELQRRSDGNGVVAHLVGETELQAIEPEARGIAALHAPEGASFDAVAYVNTLLTEAVQKGTVVRYDTRVRVVRDERDRAVVETDKHRLTAPAVLNCAGLHADRLAGPVATDLRIIPFRGYYAELRADRRGLVRSHIYAAPDLTFPFLGVHLSRRADGRVTVGPGAMLAFGREAYNFLGLNPRDTLGTLTWPGFYGLFRESRFRSLVVSEVRKSLSLRAVWSEAQLLVPSLKSSDLVRSFAGNRAQVVSKTGQLVDDIVVRESEHSVHVLNAVSPGLTCSLPFGEYLAEHCMAKVSGSTQPARSNVP
jgi:(S)-2-hydroxyglutarate dehydrogenase